MKHLAFLSAATAALMLAACGDQPPAERAEPAPAPAPSRAPAPGQDTADAPDAEAPAGETAAPSAAAGGAATGRTIRVVGASTLFPFSTAVAENFGARSGFRTPVVEGTGTGGGMNLFCAGVGQRHPDMTGASRPMLETEFALCQRNGVTEITEMMVGYDGIVLANAVTGPEVNEIDLHELFLVLAARIPMPVDADGQPLFGEDGRMRDGGDFTAIEGYACDAFIANPFGRWSDVDSALPRERIEVIGPPPTSGTRDAFVEIAMQGGARQIDCMEELRASDRGQFSEVTSRIREDGAWIDGGENDNVIVQTIAQSPAQFGIFGYSFLEQNSDRIKGVPISGVQPEYDLISSGEYPISRSMFFYVKNQHVGVVPGMAEFVEEFVSEEAFGPFGYLAERGLIALPDEMRDAERENAMSLTPMTGARTHD
jgi:phosphate transport system substrate-binding protein